MIQSAKQILLNNDILGDDPTKNHPRHEFQAYAYRLACDLKDLDRLKLYMRLAKTVERSLLEQAYSFVIDSNTTDKGKLFLWKVKQLREQIEKQKVINSYDYQTVLKHNTKLRNVLSKDIVENADKRFWGKESFVFKDLLMYALPKESKSTVLLIGLEVLPLLDLLSLSNVRLSGIDSSREIVAGAKKYMQGSTLKPKPRLIVKDLLDSTFEDGIFNVILMQSGWNSIPIDSERKYMLALKSKLAKNGKLIIRVSHSSITNQLWNNVVVKALEYLFLKKSQAPKDFEALSLSVGLEVVNRFASSDCTYYVLS